MRGGEGRSTGRRQRRRLWIAGVHSETRLELTGLSIASSVEVYDRLDEAVAAFAHRRV